METNTVKRSHERMNSFDQIQFKFLYPQTSLGPGRWFRQRRKTAATDALVALHALLVGYGNDQCKSHSQCNRGGAS